MPKLIYCIVADITEARSIANTLLAEKMVSCVNIIPSVESVFRWKGKIETEKETAMFIKTVDEKVKDTIQRINTLHSYEVPEIVVLDFVDGLKDYFDFLRKETV